MIELVLDLRIRNVLARFENDPWKNYGRESVNGACLSCRPPARPLGRRQYRGSLKGCFVKPYFVYIYIYILFLWIDYNGLDWFLCVNGENIAVMIWDNPTNIYLEKYISIWQNYTQYITCHACKSKLFLLSLSAAARQEVVGTFDGLRSVHLNSNIS